MKDENWFCDLFVWLSRKQFSIGSFWEYPITPVANKGEELNLTNSNISGTNVYWFNEAEQQKELELIPESVKSFFEIASIHNGLWQKLSVRPEFNRVKNWLDEYLNIREFNFTNFCRDVEEYLRDNFLNLEPEQIVEATRFLFENETHLPVTFNWKKLPAVFYDGSVQVVEKIKLPLVVPETFNPESGWSKIWPEKHERRHFHYLSDAYNFKLSWLKKWGVVEYPLFEMIINPPEVMLSGEEQSTLKLCKEKATSYWNASIEIPAVPSSIRNLKDSSQLISQTGESYLKLFLSYKELWTSWSYELKLGLKSVGSYLRHKWRSEECCSGLAHKLKHLAWLPTSQGTRIPNEVFIDGPSARDLLGDSVPYYSGPPLPERFEEFFKIRRSLSFDEILDILYQDSQKNSQNHELYLKIYRRLFSFAGDSDKVNSIRARFRDDKLIFVPDPENPRWVSSKDCIWKEESEIFGNFFVYLSKFYRELLEFFIRVVGVKSSADKELYARQWLKLCDSHAINNNTVESHKVVFKKIYLELFSTITTETEDRPAWCKELLRKAKILASDGSFVEPAKILFPNHKEAEGLFADSVKLVFFPDTKSLSAWQEFFSQFGVRDLRHSFSVSINDQQKPIDKTKNLKPEYFTVETLQMLATNLYEMDEEVFDEILDEGKFEKLYNIEEFQVDQSIKVTYKLPLDTIIDQAEAVREAIFVEGDSLRIYYNKNAPGKKIRRQLAREIAEYVRLEDAENLRSKIEVILGETDLKIIEEDGLSVPGAIVELIAAKEQLDSTQVALSPFADEPAVSSAEISIHPEPFKNNELPGAELHTQEDSKKVEKPEFNSDIPLNSTITHNAENEKVAKSPASQDFTGCRTPSDKLSSSDKVIGSVTATGSANDLTIFPLFNRPEKSNTGFAEEDLDLTFEECLEAGISANMSRRGKKKSELLASVINNEQVSGEERFRKTLRTLLEPSDPRIREQLRQWYHGKCQICGKTWLQHTGDVFFVAAYIHERQNASYCDFTGNALSLCAEHFAMIRHACCVGPSVNEMLQQLNSQLKANYNAIAIKINLNGKDEEITLNQQHAVDMVAFLQAFQNQVETA